MEKLMKRLSTIAFAFVLAATLGACTVTSGPSSSTGSGSGWRNNFCRANPTICPDPLPGFNGRNARE